jgi:tetratricopeptide (TPR) repeat protein
MRESGVTDPARYVDLALRAADKWSLVAFAAVSEALKIDPEYLPALKLAVTARLVLQADLKSLVTILDGILEREPQYADGYAKRAYCHAHVGSFDKALADCAKAQELKSETVMLHAAWGVAAFGKHDFATAEEKLARALKLYAGREKTEKTTPEKWELGALIGRIRDGLGAAYFARGKYKEAAVHFRELIPSDPRTQVRTTHLLWLYMSEHLASGEAAARMLVAGLAKDRHFDTTPTDCTRRFLDSLLKGDTDATVSLLGELSERNAPFGGDEAYLAGKWAQAGKRPELADACFRKAAQRLSYTAFFAILAELELHKAP